jgi:uncharacterized protein (TIGR03086 family)
MIMEDPRELFRRAGEMTAGVIAGIEPGRLGDPTPCADWDVRTLINHLAAGNLRFAAMITGEPGPGREDDVLGDDPLAAFRGSVTRLGAAFAADGVMDRTFPTPLGEGPGRMLAGMRVCELTVHGWDLAAATGQPRGLDPAVVEFASAVLRGMPVPRGGPAPFAAEQQAPEGAPAADRLAAFAGRPVPAADAS